MNLFDDNSKYQQDEDGNITVLQTIDSIIARHGGLGEACKALGWQGGTIHQVREEIKKRLGYTGMFIGKDGYIRTLKITGIEE